MSKAKTKKSSGPKEFYIDDEQGNFSIYENDPMTYEGAIKKASEFLDENYYEGFNKITVYRRVAVVQPKSEHVETVVKEIK